MTTSTRRGYDQAPDHLRGLLRHFADLRDGTHGDGAISRADKEQLFSAAVNDLDPYARQALIEMNETLLLGSGTVSATGVTRSANGDCTAHWTLRWPEQEQDGRQLFEPWMSPKELVLSEFTLWFWRLGSFTLKPFPEITVQPSPNYDRI